MFCFWGNGQHKVTMPQAATSSAMDPRKRYPVSDVANHALGGVVENMCGKGE